MMELQKTTHHTELGNHIATYQKSKAPLLFSSLCLVLAILLMMVMSLMQLPTWMALGLPLLGLTAFAWLTWEDVGTSVKLFEEGLTYQTRRRFMIVPWSEVVETTPKAFFNAAEGEWFFQEIDLTLANGQKIHIPHFTHNMWQMWSIIRQKTAVSCFLSLLKPIKQKQVVQFGDLRLTPAGVHYRAKFFQWSEISYVAQGSTSPTSKIEVLNQNSMPILAVFEIDIPNGHILKKAMMLYQTTIENAPPTPQELQKHLPVSIQKKGSRIKLLLSHI